MVLVHDAEGAFTSSAFSTSCAPWGTVHILHYLLTIISCSVLLYPFCMCTMMQWIGWNVQGPTDHCRSGLTKKVASSQNVLLLQNASWFFVL